MDVLDETLHIFVILCLVAFTISCFFASSGLFDHWNSRLAKRKKRSNNRYDDWD